MPSRIEELVLEPFKNYLLIDHIVDGGMGAIYRARFLEETMAKLVTIKMIKKKFSQDPQFKKLFMNEIRVTFPLIHPNIAQTYEYGEFDGKLFTVMEYVDGRNLKEYLVRLRALKFAFPVEVSIFITAEVCKGLSYAHSMKDQLSGKPLNIIHRDISPQNIMLTFDGSVKVIDFGIAKADTNEDKTKTGVIKGKLSYLAPEYLTGEGLDPRYDQFATGIVLWEMLCGRQLFTGETDMDKMVKIHACKIPRPSSINPRVPADLDRIVLKALSRNPDNRFEDMEQFNRALVRSLYANFPNFSPTDLSKFGPKLFAKEIAEDKKIYQMISAPGFMDSILAKLPEEVRNSIGPQESVSEYVAQSDETKEQLARLEVPPNIPLPESEEEEALPSSAEAKPIKSARKSDDKEEAKAEVEDDNKEDPQEYEDEEEVIPLYKNPLIIGAAALILVMIGYFQFKSGPNNDGAPEAVFAQEQAEVAQVPTEKPVKAMPTSAAESGLIKVSNLDLVAERFFINGELQDVGYFREVKVPLNQELVIRVEKENYASHVERVTLNNEKPTYDLIIPKRVAMSFGYLTTPNDCATGKVFFKLFDESRVEDLPLKLYQERISFPLERNLDGYTIPTKYTIQVRLEGDLSRRDVELNFERDFHQLNLCELLK